MKSLKQVICQEVPQKTESIKRFTASRRQCTIIHGCPYSLDPRLLSLGSHWDNSFLWSNKGKASLGNDPWKTIPPSPPPHLICREAVIALQQGFLLGKQWMPVPEVTDRALSVRKNPLQTEFLNEKPCQGQGMSSGTADPTATHVASRGPSGSCWVIACNHSVPSSPVWLPTDFEAQVNYPSLFVRQPLPIIKQLFRQTRSPCSSPHLNSPFCCVLQPKEWDTIGCNHLTGRQPGRMETVLVMAINKLSPQMKAAGTA